MVGDRLPDGRTCESTSAQQISRLALRGLRLMKRMNDKLGALSSVKNAVPFSLCVQATVWYLMYEGKSLYNRNFIITFLQEYL